MRGIGVSEFQNFRVSEGGFSELGRPGFEQVWGGRRLLSVGENGVEETSGRGRGWSERRLNDLGFEV